MKKIIFTFICIALGSVAAQAGQYQTCPEMDQAATAIAKINGATFASPAYRIAPMSVISPSGATFSYTFNAYYSQGDELPNKVVGTVEVKALIKTGTTACKVLIVRYNEK